MISKGNIYILEDEVLIADHLTSLVKNFGYKVLATHYHVDEFLDDLHQAEVLPDLCLLDINLNHDLDGIDIAGQLTNKNIPFVFITSNSDTRTINRVKYTEPLAFITKPFQAQNLESNLALAFHNLKSKKTTISKIDNAIFVKYKHELIRINLDDIIRIEALDNYCIIYTGDGKFTHHVTMKSMEEKVGSAFFRAHRSHLVRLSEISKIRPKSIIVGDSEVVISEKQRMVLKDKIQLL